MSSNKSQNLQLHLWEPEDNFLRTEFNANFAALDAAVKADRDAVKAEETSRKSAVSSLQTSISAKASTTALNTAKTELTTKITAAQTAADAAKTTANAAWSANNRPYVMASIQFNRGTTQTVRLGFRPSFVILFGEAASALTGTSAASGSGVTIVINDTGFTFYVSSGNEGSMMGSRGAYLAWR